MKCGIAVARILGSGYASFMFDSHCHLDDSRFGNGLDAELKAARKVGVRGFVSAGYDSKGWERQSAIAKGYSDVWCAYGLHPWAVGKLDSTHIHAELDRLEEALGSGRLAAPVALGELGLHRSRGVEMGEQEGAFVRQLGMARSLNLPVILHVVGAHGRALEVLRKEGIPEAGGVVHSYSGSAELVAEYTKIGLHLSYSGVVTFSGANRVRQAAARTPEEWLLVETDAPDQAPEPYRGQQNSLGFLPTVLESLAQAREEEQEKVREITERNARRLFHLDREDLKPR